MSRQAGNEAEDIAVQALLADDYEVLDRNYSCRVGEVDVVAKKGNIICFVEVKYRNPRGYGTAVDAITSSKMRKILMTAKSYLFKHELLDSDYRIDAVVIDGTRVEIMPDIYIEGM